MSLLSPDDLASLLVFESLTNDWAREVHIFNSKRKRGKTFVIFRNYRNKTISTLEELRLEFDDASFLDNIPFTSGHSHEIVSNKVGAGKIARKAAKKWMEESANRPTENITKIGFIIKQQTKDVFKSKEHESSDEECAKFMDKRSSHQNKMSTTTEEIDKELTNEKIISNT